MLLLEYSPAPSVSILRLLFFVQAGPSLGSDHGRTQVGHSVFGGLLPAGLGALGKVRRRGGGARWLYYVKHVRRMAFEIRGENSPICDHGALAMARQCERCVGCSAVLGVTRNTQARRGDWYLQQPGGPRKGSPWVVRKVFYSVRLTGE